MTKQNINIMVGGPVCEDYQRIYKIKYIKPNLSFGLQITEPNTKYVIRYNIDLSGETITIPKNCILEFDGGSIDNGTLIGQNTAFINVGDVDIWGSRLTREGTWKAISGGEGGIPDKDYDPDNHSGLGRKTLQLKNGNNILTQEDFDKENTIYVIGYDFDLNDENITIPENCILEFDGGSITGGSITLNNDTTIIGGKFIKTILKSPMNEEEQEHTESGITYKEIIYTPIPGADPVSNISIKDTIIDGNGEVTFPLLNFNNAKHIYIHNVIIQNFKQDGSGRNYRGTCIHCAVIKDCEDVVWDHVTLQNIYPEAPWFESCKRLLLNDIYFDSSTQVSEVFTLLHCFFCKDVCLSNSYFKKTRVDGSTINFTCKNALIEGCVFDGGQGIDMSNEINDDFSSEDIVVQDCKIINSYFCIYTYPSEQNVKNITVRNCVADILYFMRLHNTYGVYVDNCNIKCQMCIHPTKSAEGYIGPYTKLMGDYVFTNNSISCFRLISIQSGLLVSENWYEYIQNHPTEKDWWNDGSVWVKFDGGIKFENNKLTIDSSLYPGNEQHPTGSNSHANSAIVACQSMSYVPEISFIGCVFEGDIEKVISNSSQNINIHKLDIDSSVMSFDDYENDEIGKVLNIPTLNKVNITNNTFKYCCIWVKDNMNINNNTFIVNTSLSDGRKQYPLRFEYGNNNTVISNNNFGDGKLYFYSLDLNKGTAFIFDKNTNYDIYYSQTANHSGLKALLSLHQNDINLSSGGNSNQLPNESNFDIPVCSSFYDNENGVLFFDGQKWTDSSKHIVINDKNDFVYSNTTYIIRKDIDLNVGTVTMPANSILRFDGGRLINGTIIGNHTVIYGQKNCFGEGVLFGGSINSEFHISWLTLVGDYDTYNIECLSSLNTAADKVIWDVPEIYILHKEGVSIPIRQGVMDLNGTKFYCKSLTEDCVLFEYAETLTPIESQGNEPITLDDIINNSAFTDKCGYLVIEDENPIVIGRVGYGGAAYRKDIICVKNNRAINNTILPYNDGESSISASYFYGNYNTITIKNFSINRDVHSEYFSKIIKITNAHDVVISDINIHTPISELYGGKDFEIASVYNLAFKNININGSYSQERNYGYVFALNNIFNLDCDTLCGDALWGIFGCNNINKVSIYNSQINRFDCHCYSRDWLFVGCNFAHLYNQIGVHFGYIKFDSCEFTDFIPILTDSSYCSATKYNAIFDNCVFNNIQFVVSMIVSKTTFDSTQHRVLLSNYDLPDITIGGIFNLSRNSFILRKSDDLLEYDSYFKLSYKNLTINICSSGELVAMNSSLKNVLIDIDGLRYVYQDGWDYKNVRGITFSTDLTTIPVTLSNLKVHINNSYFPTNYSLKKEFYDGTDTIFTIENSIIPWSTYNTYTGIEYINCDIVCRYQEDYTEVYNFVCTQAIVYKNCRFKKEFNNEGYLLITSDKSYHFQNCSFDVQPRYFNLYKNIDCVVSDNKMYEGYSEGITDAELSSLFTLPNTVISRFKCYNKSTFKYEYYINKVLVPVEAYYGEIVSGIFAHKPSSSTNIPIGFQYFCTDKQTVEGAANGIVIYYKGQDTTDPQNPVDIWIDALGRVIS